MFSSFFLAGFEGATGVNRHRQWFDQIAATGHDVAVDDDYRRVAELGIRGVREAIRWPIVDRGGGVYDFSSVEPFAAAARRHGITVIWDLFHYGFPADTDPWEESFAARFADYCQTAARYLIPRTDGALLFTPLNEPSFLAYAAGEKGLFAPFSFNRGWEMKVTLVKAAIAGIDAIRAEAPDARFVNVDPVCRVVPASPSDEPDVTRFNTEEVFQSWDMLAGRLLPEIGGSRAHLDIVGVNYYWTNQWEWGRAGDPLAEDDERRAPFVDILRSVWRRYGGEILVSETAHVGEGRAPWLREIATASTTLLNEGVPLRGVCLYPVLGIPEWHERERWTPMGLWDPDEADPFRRVPHEPAIDVLCQTHPELCATAGIA